MSLEVNSSYNQVTVNPTFNTVQIFPDENPLIIRILTPGPQGPQGHAENTSSFVNFTASYYNNSASFSSSIDGLSGSFLVFSSSFQTGSFTGSFSGDGSLLVGVISSSYASNATSASYSNNSTSSSYALTASFSLNVPLTASYAASASQAISSSYSTAALSASYALSSLSASYAVSSSFAQEAAFSLSSSYTLSASQAQEAVSSSQATSSSYSSYALSASYSANVPLTASYATSASQAITSSYANNATSSSYASTSSYADNFTVGGTLTAQTINVQTITSSIVYSSGSNKLGNLLSNTQVFTGSVSITGSLVVNGPVTMTGTITSTAIVNPLITAAESWVGPTSGSGVYFKGGNVGIGTVAPTYPLHVNRTGANDYVIVQSDNGYNTGLIGKNASGFTGGLVISSNGDGIIYGSGLGTTPLAWTNAGILTVARNLIVQGTGNTTIAGNVGIGTTTPSQMLDVVNNQSGLTLVRAANNSTDLLAQVGFGVFSDNVQGYLLARGSGYATSPFANSLTLMTNNAYPLYLGTDAAIRMTILPTSGNVGIGTTTPTVNLAVGNDLGSAGYTATDRVISVGSAGSATSQRAAMLFGQDATHLGTFMWNSNPTAANAKFTINTYGYANPIHIDGSVLALQSQSSGNVGIGLTIPTAVLHLKAGTATAGTAPLKLTQSGSVLLSAPEPGAIECNDGDLLYYTIKTGSARKTISFIEDLSDELDFSLYNSFL